MFATLIASAVLLGQHNWPEVPQLVPRWAAGGAHWSRWEGEVGKARVRTFVKMEPTTRAKGTPYWWDQVRPRPADADHFEEFRTMSWYVKRIVIEERGRWTAYDVGSRFKLTGMLYETAQLHRGKGTEIILQLGDAGGAYAVILPVSATGLSRLAWGSTEQRMSAVRAHMLRLKRPIPVQTVTQSEREALTRASRVAEKRQGL